MTSEIQYIYLLNKLLEDGEERETRNGKTLSIFGYRMEFDLQEGFPLLTTKKMFFKGIMTELAWFLRGSTDVTELHKYNNRILQMERKLYPFPTLKIDRERDGLWGVTPGEISLVDYISHARLKAKMSV